ncbi:MAG: hypothetical protein WCX61_05480 [Candidatus Peribacteraceae bacterium]|jgi:hypothetical protein
MDPHGTGLGTLELNETDGAQEYLRTAEGLVPQLKVLDHVEAEALEVEINDLHDRLTEAATSHSTSEIRRIEQEARSLAETIANKITLVSTQLDES